jgi:AraC family transcriptional regulator, regulatory protein of adaptative response / DNA-3-methyladenine glycosylase II
MDTYSAVVTTGIYCRPGCPGRPRAENVRRFANPAAAEAAGFRACHRCRPYRIAVPAADGWAGPDLVCRAVQLVLGGALDRGGEADLAARLGVSPRHLRRLFAEHVGTTPDALARSRRAHFARRLLDDTDLSVTAVAYAAGFGSPRQLNRACAEVFRATPSELRSRRRATDRLAADGGLALRLPFAGPLDRPALLDYFGLRSIPGVERVDGGAYRRTIVVDGDPGVLEVLPGGDDHVVLRFHLPHWEGLIHLVERARRMLGLDTDGAAAARHLAADPALGPRVAARRGLRVPGAWDPLEIGVRAIVGQQVSVAAASTVTGRIVARHGTPVPGLAPLGLTHTFPTAATLAGGDLDGLGLTGARARAIRAFAAAVDGGDIPLDPVTPLDDLVAAVTAVPGLGPWTAHYLALRLGRADAFPASDLGLIRGLARLDADAGRPAAAAPLAGRAEAWRPWRALAAVHLWAYDAAAPAAPAERAQPAA